MSRDAWGITGCNSDRVSQTVNGVTTHYVLDMNSDLTQVLSDGTNDYIYGVGHIAQVNATGTEYFLGDALSSVRQLTDVTGAVTLAKSYQPYGEVLNSVGSGTTSYGFTGEMSDDSTGLVYLRARYYSSEIGRFLTRDSWQGDYNRPLSLNRWNYVEGNPINLSDPSGHISEKQAKRAELILNKLDAIYNVHIKKDWGYRLVTTVPSSPFVITGSTFGCEWEPGNWRDISELENVFQGVKVAASAMRGPAKFKSAMGNKVVHITRLNVNKTLSDWITTRALPVVDILYTNYGFDSGRDFVVYSTVHELGHVWDIHNGFQLSSDMAITLGTYICTSAPGRGGTSCYFDIKAGKESPPGARIDPYAGRSIFEDWAEAFANYADPAYYASMAGYIQLGPLRRQYVQDQINAIP